NNGGGGTISDGDTQWMTAGAGILHIETPPESLVMSGGLFHGFQLWVNLPAAKKWSPPAYQDVRAKDVALLSSSDGGSLLRVIAGEVDGHAGPGTTQTPITLIHANTNNFNSRNYCRRCRAAFALATRLQRTCIHNGWTWFCWR
ncbi:MAG: hypothetical protein RL290_710, partial [Actinomycetota bacterium]